LFKTVEKPVENSGVLLLITQVPRFFTIFQGKPNKVFHRFSKFKFLIIKGFTEFSTFQPINYTTSN